MLERNQRTASHHHRTRLRKIHGHDRDIFQVDVLPDVQLGPVRERKHTDAFVLVHAAVEQIPELGPLVLGVPLSEAVAKRINPLFGSRLFLIAARTAKRRIKTTFGQGIEQRPRLQ